MSKRSVRFGEDDEQDNFDRIDEIIEGHRSKKFKNSLDSDEEDDEVNASKYDVLDPDELEGQEEGTVDYDGEIKITPFNMKDELEEGHFDKEGTFIFHKDQNEIKDSWLDNIDWVKVKKVEQIKPKDTDDDSLDFDTTINIIEHYRNMLEIMNPGETVQKALCRLGGKKKSQSASSRWNKKKQTDQNGTEDEEKRKEDQEKLLTLTTLANDIVISGDMDIYQQTYERLQFLIRVDENKKSRTEITSSAKGDDDDALDMFGEKYDSSVAAAADAARREKMSEVAQEIEDADSSKISSVMWEFKWENTDDARIYGPHETSEMIRWVEDGYFEQGVWVRQIGKHDFYNSRRIDFELYT